MMTESIKSTLLWVGLSVVILASVIGIMYVVDKNSSTSQIPSLDKQNAQIKEGENVKGNPQAKVQIIEYSDFQCPACASTAPFIKTLVDNNLDKIYFSYRHFPLPFHKNAKLASEVAEASRMQGKFFEMHDMLFERQADWAEDAKAKEKFVSYAKELGLNTEQFLIDLEREEVKKKVKDDEASAYASRIPATPTFFVNGKSFSGKTMGDFIKEIEKLETINK